VLVPVPVGDNVNAVGPASSSRKKTTPRKAAKRTPVQTSPAVNLSPNQSPSPEPVRRQEDADVTTGSQSSRASDSSSEVEVIEERGIPPGTPPLTPGPTPASCKRAHLAQVISSATSLTPLARSTELRSEPTPSTPSRTFLSPVPSTPVPDPTKGGAASLPTPSKTFPSPARRLFQDGCHDGHSRAGPSIPTPKGNLAVNKRTPEHEVIEILTSDEEDVFSTPRPKSNYPVPTPRSQKRKRKTENIQLGDIMELSD